VLGDSLVPCLGCLIRIRAVLLERAPVDAPVLVMDRLWYCYCLWLLSFQILLDLKGGATG
jgi:hypothetical protein